MAKIIPSNYILYKDYLKKRDVENKCILISKTNNSYVVGPLINEKFDEESFYKRTISNSIYNPKIYKKISEKKCLDLIAKYQSKLSSNEVIEVFKNGEIIVHKIICVPGDNYGK